MANRFIRMGKNVRGFGAAAAMVASLFGAGTAEAHGGAVRAFEILENKAKPEQFVLRSDVWGFFHSSDAGKHWQWSCSTVYGTPSTQTNRVEMALTPKGRLIVANGFDGVFYTDDFCSWSKSAGFAAPVDGGSEPLLWDVIVLPDETVLALTSTGSATGMSNRIWSSQDGGATFTLARDLKQPDDTYTGLIQAPSRASRIYAIGSILGADKAVLQKTDDGGATFQRVEGPPLGNPGMIARVHAVHPTNPDVLVIWLDIAEVQGQDSPDELWYTSDAGSTWHLLVKSKGDMPGFAFSPDGKTLAAGGSLEGVRSAPLSDVLAGGAAAFSVVNERPAWGLLWNAAGLYAGKDNFTARGTPETFTLGISEDAGKTFDEVVGICDFEFSHCAKGTAGHDMCQNDWEDPDPLKGGFKQDFWVNSERCGTSDGGTGAVSGSGAASGSGGGSSGNAGGKAGSSGGTGNAGGSGNASGSGNAGGGNGVPDAGTGAPDVKVDSGCSCSTPGTATPGGALAALALSALGFGLGLRRRSFRGGA